MLALRMRRPRQVLVATNAEELVANRRDPNGHATLVYGRPGAASLGRRGLSRWPDRSALHPPDYSTHQTTPPSRNLPDSPPPGYVGTHLYLLPEQTVMHGAFEEDSSMQQAPQ